ncbi:MAG TPA: hypothetical protein VMC09_02745 [Anaerolineales bacterium]|nr:hypothetical protein [Anaerolineales bacterium]
MNPNLVWEIRSFIKRQPLKTIGILLAAWIFLACLNGLLHFLDPGLDTAIWFPISIFFGPAFHLSGLPYAILFLGVLYLAFKLLPHLNQFTSWLLGLLFILLGNLAQGNFDIAFRQPFYLSGTQYYSDALKISSWRAWLEAFNNQQASLFVHSRTHPPFAVLLHYLLIRLSGNNLAVLAGVFILISSLSIPLLGLILGELGIDRVQRNRLVLLFSLLPAINIYTAVSLDGLILTTCTLFLLGLVMLLRRQKFSLAGAFLIFAGLTLTNLLTFGGLFLVAVGLGLGTLDLLLNRKTSLLLTSLASVVLLVAGAFILNSTFHYNHLQAFLTSSRIENPDGFRLLTQPLEYLMSRIEGISEIGLFLSIGCLAALFQKDRIKTITGGIRIDTAWGIALTGLVIVAGMFLIGMFRTGETARTCLFIYPYLVLIFYKDDPGLLGDLTIIAALQTIIMQLCGNYYW